jgi:putative transcriptional regulator
MDMHVFQVESNKVLPQQGSILISSPFMNDYHFTRAVVLLIEHNDEGSMGIIMNKASAKISKSSSFLVNVVS